MWAKSKKLKGEIWHVFVKWTKKMVKPEIKAIIFDLGGVLVFYDHMLAAKPMAKLTGISLKKIFRLLSSSGENSKFSNLVEKGANSQVYWKEAAKELGVKELPYKKCNYLWDRIFWPNKRLFAILPKLKKKYKIGLISNLGKVHKKTVSEKYKLVKLIDYPVYSCDIKLRKPNQKVYKICLSRLKCFPQEVIFIDDIPKNIKSARKLGINSILFKTNKQLFKQLKQLGVEV